VKQKREWRRGRGPTWAGALEKKKDGKRGIGPTKEKRPKRFEGEEKFFFLFSNHFINCKLF
jgi:hypothetical protein